jgi:hypothetical protein
MRVVPGAKGPEEVGITIKRLSRVGKRLGEALRTLRHMPVDGYLAGYTNSWLAILHEYSDRATYEDDPVWKAERAAESNWSRPRPSSAEIADRNGDRVAGPRAIYSPARPTGNGGAKPDPRRVPVRQSHEGGRMTCRFWAPSMSTGRFSTGYLMAATREGASPSRRCTHTPRR